MADLRGQELRDSYQNVVTRGAGATPIEDGNGSPYFYEQGIWTPRYTTEGGDFSSDEYQATEGSYIKVGDYVTVLFSMLGRYTDIGSASGGVRIKGLPFTVGSSPQYNAAGEISYWDLTPEYPIGLRARSATNFIELKKLSANFGNATGQLVDVLEMRTDSSFRNRVSAQITYKIA